MGACGLSGGHPGVLEVVAGVVVLEAPPQPPLRACWARQFMTARSGCPQVTPYFPIADTHILGCGACGSVVVLVCAGGERPAEALWCVQRAGGVLQGGKS
ncbi:hypothetical protein E2C01_072609 [Portunus trituberculatus]|uniref:Uncharacterized protein n=1 Tax=Portunus trituberculatus TaxID=210409 RepID=A0A5B7I8A7_PORTR|nr:hypothetical protein [Portunus trituberculatus]